MKAIWNFDYEFPIYTNGVNCAGGWTTGYGKAGDVSEHPDCWKLCCIRDHGPLSPTFGKYHAEPADDECEAITKQYRDAERAEILARSGSTDPEADFKKRFGIVDEEAEAKEAATAEFESRLMEGV